MSIYSVEFSGFFGEIVQAVGPPVVDFSESQAFWTVPGWYLAMLYAISNGFLVGGFHLTLSCGVIPLDFEVEAVGDVEMSNRKLPRP